MVEQALAKSPIVLAEENPDVSAMLARALYLFRSLFRP
jgi:hypothetical protein